MNPSFCDLERAAAARSRGLDSAFDWPFLLAAARELAAEDLPENSCDDNFSPFHFAAARVLDGAAQFAPQNAPAQSRELGLWAAAAFAQSGNVPSATVAARRTFVRVGHQDGETAALLGAVAPSLAWALRGASPFAAHLSRFLSAGDEKDAVSTRQSWDDIAAKASAKYPPALWQLARRGLDAALCLATARVLHECATLWPAGFAQKLARAVPVLLPPQARALRNGDWGETNALVALAPGGGKTLLGELFLASALARGDGNESRWAVFVVPYVALGRGVVAPLRAHFPADIAVHSWIGSARDDEIEPFGGGLNLVVATPERLDSYLRRHPYMWPSLRAIVCDEAHLIGDGARGVRLEGLLTRLQNREKAPRLLLLSAALGDCAELARWIGARRVVSSRFAPTARRFALWKSDGQLQWHAELAENGVRALGETGFVAPHPHLPVTGNWPLMQRHEPSARENVAHLAHHLWQERGGPILCLCATRRATRELALALGRKWDETSEICGSVARAIAAIEARHRTLLPLAALLRRGIAWHNASLPAEVRAAVEAGVSAGEIHVVAATSTLAEGVDLPFQISILADWLGWDEGGQRPLSPALFRNIAGRCGRAGAFTEGDTILFDNPLGDEKFTAPTVRAALQNALIAGADLAPPRSALETVGEEENGAMRGAVEAAFETQLLAACGENEGDFPDRFLSATFLFQRDGAAWERWRERAGNLLSSWENEELLTRQNEVWTLTPRGQAWRASDLSPATCRRLLGTLGSLPRGDFSGVAGRAKLNAHLWRALGAAPEAGSEIARFFAPRSRFAATPADLEHLGASWLRGDSPETIFAALPRVRRANYAGLENWVEGLENQSGDLPISPQWSASYERWLDFGRAGLETWAPQIWRASALLAPFCGGAASQINWRGGAALWQNGVDSPWASRAARAGAPGTRAAIAALGRVWPFESDDFAGDPLVLAPLQHQAARERAQAAFDAALEEVGGRHCFAGRNLLALRDWLWGKAGLNK